MLTDSIESNTNGDAVEVLADRKRHKRKVEGEVKVSIGEVHGTKVRGVSANSPKICSYTVICCVFSLGTTSTDHCTRTYFW